MIDASPSTNDDAAHTITLSALASRPAISPTTPSTVIHTSDAQDNARARRAVLTHAGSGSRPAVDLSEAAVLGVITGSSTGLIPRPPPNARAERGRAQSRTRIRPCPRVGWQRVHR